VWLLTLKSILVATDPSDPSPSPLRTAAVLAQLAGARLHLLHVGENPGPSAEARLREHFRLAAPDAPPAATTRVVPGSPAAEIVAVAGKVDADAIILGPHRKAGADGEMGSTAATVVRTAPCPCLVAAAELRLPLDHVLVPIDVSEIATGALSVALSWASALRPPGGTARVTVLHVTPDPSSQAAQQAVSDEVQRARSRVGGAAHVDIQEVVLHGTNAADEILRSAESESADLVVMGTRGAEGATDGLGSVSNAVARGTRCPLLLVPPATWEHRGGS
jgi:nucleotide-binding universal stress UspA family protein